MCLTRKFLTAAIIPALVLTLAASFTPSARANVYATNIKLNGSLTNTTSGLGSPVNISFILNEQATLGTTINILSGSTVLRSISIPFGDNGTLSGLNTVAWDGKDNGGSFVPLGTYVVSITAATSGYTDWTQTSTDFNDGYYVFAPRGIAVNNNSNSPYYGRVFVGNATQNSAGSQPGDVDGILKANADGSLADEGQTNGGYNWIDDGFSDSPHFLRYGQDDRIYALDLTGTGVIVALNQTMSTNQVVLTLNNYANNPFKDNLFAGWGMFDVTDAGTPQGRLWLGDYDSPGGAGLWAWHMVNGVADPNDHIGQHVIAVGGDLDVAASGGSMMDAHSNIFIGQDITDGGALPNRAMVFTNWNGASTLTSGTAWSVGGNDDTFLGNYDLAIDSRAHPKYVALCLSSSGGLRVLNAADGSIVTNGAQVLNNLDGGNNYYGVAWDAVGNLYGAINNPDLNNKWRVFSPPGTNQATTVAVATVQITAPSTGPFIISVGISGTTITIPFIASPSDVASAFTLQSSSTVIGIYTPVSGANITAVGGGIFEATAPISGPMRFYRIKR